MFSLHSCIEQFTPKLNDSDTQNLLVVEGQITDETGPFKVRLTNSVLVYSDPNILNKDHPVYGADVQIFDDQGNVFNLYEDENGWYETRNKQLQGVVGNTYTLLISTDDNKQYESSPVLMQETPDIEKIHFEEVTRTHFDELVPIEESWLDISVDTKSLGDEAFYLKWEFEETWEYKMPEYIDIVHYPGYINEYTTTEVVDVDFDKLYCWITEPSREILVESTVGYQKNRVRNFVLQTIGPSSDKLKIKYSILVKQFTINSDLYSILKKLREVNKETDGIFSKIPAQAFGNITCCDGGENVLGYFFASAVKTKRIFIDRFDHNVKQVSAYDKCGWHEPFDGHQKQYFFGKTNVGGLDIWSTDNYCTDCRIRGTNIKPDFWE